MKLRLALLMVLLSCAASLHAQRDSALSNTEIEQIRECRYIPNDCIVSFTRFLDLRTQEIAALYAKPRRPGREQDTHDLIEQFTSIADELSDNLDDYGPRHADIRRTLPKLIEATERWASTIKSPPDNEAYSISRKIALESIHDLREAATQLIDDQTAWFKAHPPAKQKDSQENEPITIPR